jgi:thioredoxin-dependent peroxiredoxin
MTLNPGDEAPDFSLEADTGETVRLRDLRGRIVVLYFYPKDDTPGCTIESCEFRDAFPRFTGLDAEILGVSPDDAASHRRFKAKFSLPFRLLADEGHRVADAYGVWVEKTNYGRTYMGVERATFIVGRDGRLLSVYRKVKAQGHAEAVENDIAALAAS